MERTTLRVMSYNIRSGRGTDDRTDLCRIAAVIASFDPDVVALQEVDAGRPRSGAVDQAGELAARLGMEARFAATVASGDERYGIATLTRLPIEESSTRCLPRRGTAEPRCSLATRMTWPAGGEARPIELVNTHLSVRRRERPAQAEALACDGPGDLVLAGDLNCTGWSAVLRRLCCGLSAAVRARSWPARLPLIQLDHILFRGALRVVRSGAWKAAGARAASDHLPVVAEFAAVARRAQA